MKRGTASNAEPDTYIVDLKNRQPLEAGADMAALVLWPPPSEMNTRFETALALKRVHYGALADDLDWSTKIQNIRPYYIRFNQKNQNKWARMIETRLRHRVGAGHMAMRYVLEFLEVEGALPIGCKKFTREALMEPLCKTLGEPDITNAMKRIWRPSYPVLHLCAALDHLQNRQKRAISIFELILSRDGLIEWVMLSEIFRECLLRSKLKLRSNTMIRLELAV